MSTRKRHVEIEKETSREKEIERTDHRKRKKRERAAGVPPVGSVTRPECAMHAGRPGHARVYWECRMGEVGTKREREQFIALRSAQS